MDEACGERSWVIWMAMAYALFRRLHRGVALGIRHIRFSYVEGNSNRETCGFENAKLSIHEFLTPARRRRSVDSGTYGQSVSCLH